MSWARPSSHHRVDAGRSTCLRRVDLREQGAQRRDRHDGGNRRRAAVIVLLELGDDQQRRDLGHHGNIAGVKIADPYSPTARANDSANPVNSAGSSAGNTTRANVCRRDAERPRSFLEFRASSTRAPLHGYATNGRPTNVSATTMPSGVKATYAARREHTRDPAVAGEQAGQRDAGDGCRQRERQVDQRVHQSPAGNA